MACSGTALPFTFLHVSDTIQLEEDFTYGLFVDTELFNYMSKPRFQLAYLKTKYYFNPYNAMVVTTE
jgi:hypothetical protein